MVWVTDLLLEVVEYSTEVGVLLVILDYSSFGRLLGVFNEVFILLKLHWLVCKEYFQYFTNFVLGVAEDYVVEEEIFLLFWIIYFMELSSEPDIVLNPAFEEVSKVLRLVLSLRTGLKHEAVRLLLGQSKF